MRGHWAGSERGPTGFDEYEGAFGPLAAAPTSFPARQRPGLMPNLTSSGRTRPSRRRHHSRLAAPGFDRREKFLASRSDRRRKMRLGDRVDGSSGDDAANITANTTAKLDSRQVWLPTRSFAFRQRAGKLDTRAIARLDLAKIAATTDVEAVQRHLENVAFADVTLEDVQQFSDAYFLKLFQVAQLTLEYLLHVQESLAEHSESLEAQCERLLGECQALEADNDTQEAEIAGLKRDVRQKQRTMATLELMLLNVGSQKLPIATGPDKENEGERANALVDELLTSSVNEEGGDGLGIQPVECVLCEKRFVSVEYLLRHQQKKHQRKHRRCSSRPKKGKERSSGSSSSSSSSSSSGKRSSRSKHPPPEPVAAPAPPTPLPKEVLDALEEKNHLARQLVELQSQVRAEQDARDAQRRQVESQQSQLTTQVMDHLGQLQAALAAMERKQEAARLDMIKHTEEAIKRMQEETAEASKRARKTAERVGTLESDLEESAVVHPASASTVRDAAGEWSQLEKVMDTFLRAQALKQQEIDALQHKNAKLSSKASKRSKRSRDFPEQSTTLMAMAALDAARFGVDYGQIPVKRAEVDEKTVQTDEEELKPTAVAIVELTTLQPDPTARDKRVLPKPAILVRSRSSLPAASATPTVTAEPPVRAVAVSTQPATRAPTGREIAERQAAERDIAKAVVRYLRWKQLKRQPSWQLVISVSGLEKALSRQELGRIRRQHGDHVRLSVTRGTTANQLRREIASELSGGGGRDGIKAFDLEDSGDEDGETTVAVSRVLLRHKRLGVELCSDRLRVDLFEGELEVGILPDATEKKKGLPVKTTRDPTRGVTLLQAQARGLAARLKFLAVKRGSRRAAEVNNMEASVPTLLADSNDKASSVGRRDPTPSRLPMQCQVIRQRLSVAVASRLSSDYEADVGGQVRSEAEAVSCCLANVDAERKKLPDSVQERVEQLEARLDAMLPDEMALQSAVGETCNEDEQLLSSTRRRLDELLFGIRTSEARGVGEQPRALLNELIASVFPHAQATTLDQIEPISGQSQPEPKRRESAGSREIQALADAYELDQSTSAAVVSKSVTSRISKASTASRVSVASTSQQPASRLRHAERSVAVVARASPVAVSSTASREGRPGTPTPELEAGAASGRGSPPLEAAATPSTVISPFSKTPLISRRVMRGSGFANAR